MAAAIQGTNPNATAQPQKKNTFKRIREAINKPKPSDRIADDFGILKEVAGLRYLQNIKDTEQRRTEIIQAMTELNELEFCIIQNKDGTKVESIQQSFLFNSFKLAKLFQLYFITGSPWTRGADNESLSQATAAFIENFEDVGDLPSAFRTLHSEAIYLLHLSWQGIDVTNTPAYVISSTPIFTPANVPRVDLSGNRTNTTPAEQQTAPQPKHERIQP